MNTKINLDDASSPKVGAITAVRVAFAGRIFEVSYTGSLTAKEYHKRLDNELERLTGRSLKETENIYRPEHKSEKTFIDEYGTIPEDVKEEFNKLFEEIATETKVISTDQATKSLVKEYAKAGWLQLQEKEKK